MEKHSIELITHDIIVDDFQSTKPPSIIQCFLLPAEYLNIPRTSSVSGMAPWRILIT